jgi:hypothetical protein
MRSTICRKLLDGRQGRKVAAGFLDARRIQVEVVPSGWWQRLVFPKDRPAETVDKAAYVFCVLEQFHQRLKRRDIFAGVSERWGGPRARPLDGEAWQQAKTPALNALQLPEEPRELLAGHAVALDEAWRQVAAGLAVDTAARLDDEGRLHAQKVTAVPDPPMATATAPGSVPARAGRDAGAGSVFDACAIRRMGAVVLTV